MILLLILYALLALTFVIAQKAVQVSSPLFFIAIRMITAGVLLLGYSGVVFGKKTLPKRSDWALFGIVTLLHIYFAFVLEFWALKDVGGLKANFLYSLTPFITFIIERFWVNKKERITKLLGVFIGFCGIIPLLGIHCDVINFTVTLPDLVLLGAIISAASAWFFIKLLFGRHYSIVIINGWSMFFGGILSLITAFFGEYIYIADMQAFFWCLFSLIMLSNIIIYTLYGILITRYSLTLITTAGFLCPLFGLLYDWMLYGILPNILYIPAFICITTGLTIVYMSEKHNALPPHSTFI